MKAAVNSKDIVLLLRFRYSTNQNCLLALFHITSSSHTGLPKKVSHYRQSSLNRIKNRKPG